MNPDEPMVPASTVKLFTTGFARSVLGGSARRSTKVVGIGGVDPETGAWVGSWALELNGDPTLERAQGSGPTLHDLALQLASGGIRKLTGPLQVQSADGPATAHLSRRVVGAPPGPPLRAAGRPAHAPREHRLDHRASRRQGRAAGPVWWRPLRRASRRW